LEGHAARAARFAGTYQGNRIAYSSVGKLNIINNLLQVTVTDDGMLEVGGDRFVEVEPRLFVNVENPDDRIAFRVDENDEPTHLLVGDRPNQAWERVAWYRNPMVHAGVLAVRQVLFLASLVVWSVGLQRRETERAGVVGVARGVGLGLSVLAIAAVVALGV
jgi:hypothetical protein